MNSTATTPGRTADEVGRPGRLLGLVPERKDAAMRERDAAPTFRAFSSQSPAQRATQTPIES
jgi:hypothetical protein